MSNASNEYVDGFVIVVPTDKIDAYREVATEAAAIWREHGALDYRECIGDDLEVTEQVPFPKLAGAKEGETVIFSWVVFPSRAARDEANAKIMEDPRVAAMCEKAKAAFDCKRMAYGGFKTLVH